MNDRRPPLEGVRILAQGLAWAGPTATVALSDLGAEVIEIESIQHLNLTRTRMRHIPDALMAGQNGNAYANRDNSEGFWDRQVWFNYGKRGCLSATFDLESQRGRELFVELAKRSDVFLENNAAGVVGRLGIGWDVLHAANPALIMARFPGFGITGPYAHFKGIGPIMEAVAGHTAVRGYAGSDPSTTPASLHSDPNAGTHIAFAVQAALLARERTGQGQLIELSQVEAMVHQITYDVLDYTFNGRERVQRGNDHPAFAPYGVFPSAGKDSWIAIACESDAAFAALARQLDAAEWADDERFATTVARLRHRTAVNDLVAERTRLHAPGDLARALQASGVPAAALAHQQEMLADGHLAARGFLTEITSAAGTYLYPNTPGRLEHTAIGPPFGPAPTLGQHNEYVYKEIIGLPDQEYRQLVDDQSIGTVYLESAHA
jgi:crotonobetainyl-CoA:carnitine CoA-transferase CaiB-like acyl-CoA transferase